jgi:hypothetical protein
MRIESPPLQLHQTSVLLKQGISGGNSPPHCSGISQFDLSEIFAQLSDANANGPDGISDRVTENEFFHCGVENHGRTISLGNKNHEFQLCA